MDKDEMMEAFWNEDEEYQEWCNRKDAEFYASLEECDERN